MGGDKGGAGAIGEQLDRDDGEAADVGCRALRIGAVKGVAGGGMDGGITGPASGADEEAEARGDGRPGAATMLVARKRSRPRLVPTQILPSRSSSSGRAMSARSPSARANFSGGPAAVRRNRPPTR